MQRNPIEFPCQPDEFKTELEVKRSSSVLVVTRSGNNTEASGQRNDSLQPAHDDTQLPENDQWIDIKRYSDFRKVIRIATYVMRFRIV